jgi:glycosyltransferase involved in cell wall biosynthesis
MTPTIAAVIIMKNEEVLLEQCLSSLKGLDELVLCDTGSTDRTLDIARNYTDKVYTDFTWNDSFADARNHAKNKATSDWILSIDVDETLADVTNVREAVALAEQQQVLAVDVTLIAEDNGQTFQYPRLFKNDSRVFWEGNIHNTLSVLGEKIGDVRIQVGYSPAHKNDPNRAFRILKKEIDEAQAQHKPFSPRTMFYLGREYFYRGEYDKTVICLGKYVQVSRFLSEKAEAFLTMARAYWAMKMPDDARDACVQALIINANFAEALDFMAILAGEGTNHERWEANARQWRRLVATATNDDVLFVRKI